MIGTAFFPGGSGLYLEPNSETSDPSKTRFGGVMILGHNFDSELGFQGSFERKKEILTKGTWLGVLKRLKDVPIPLAQCFFTNAFMGLSEGAKSTNYHGRGDPRFRAACALFLKAQIEAQKPRLIVPLGPQVPPLLASITSALPILSRGRAHSRVAVATRNF